MTKTKADRAIPEWEKEFVEAGAHLEHERWAKWQAYLHSKCVEHENGKGEWVCFPAESFRHWERQIDTPYADLSESEKESDRKETRNYLPILRTSNITVVKAIMEMISQSIDSMDEQNHVTQAILGALEYRGFYDAEKYLDGTIWEHAKPILKEKLLADITAGLAE